MPDQNPAGPKLPSTDEYLKKFEPLVEAWDKFKFMDDPRWGPTATLSPIMRASIAVQLENVRKTLLPNSTVVDPSRDDVKISEAYQTNIRAALKISERMATEQGYMPITEAAVDTTAFTSSPNLPMVLGYVRKIMPKMRILDFVSQQPMSLPSGKVFYIDRTRDNNGTAAGSIENRAGWSFRSFDASPGENSTITKTAKFTLASETVTTSDHKFMTQVGIEIEQDLRAYHGIDAAALIAEAATDEMALDLSELILYELWARAGAGTFSIGVKPSGYTVSEWDRRYLEVITKANEAIWTSQRVNAQHVILGSDWAVQLSNINNVYSPAPVQDFATGNTNRSLDGGLRTIGDYTAMKVPLPFPTGQGLVLHKGTSWIDASYFYLPYVAFQPYGVFRDPRTQTQYMSWLSRYATYMVGTNFRGDRRVALIKIDNTLTGTSYPAFVESVGAGPNTG